MKDFMHIWINLDNAIKFSPFKGDNYDVSETRTGFC